MSLMDVFPSSYSKGSPTYCLIPAHKPSAAPLKEVFSDGKTSSTEERMACANEVMLLSSSLIEQAQYGNG